MRPSDGPATTRYTERPLRLAAVMAAVALAGGMLFATTAGASAQGPQSSPGALAKARIWHTATRLDDGSVFVVGGRGLDSGAELRSAELYDPATQDFTRVGSFAEGRSFHTATFLADGRVLIVGGDGILKGNVRRAIPSAELYDPTTQQFTTVGPMQRGRRSHTATLLDDGQVLIVGASDEDGRRPAVEVHDPQNQAFSPVGSPVRRRVAHTATRLDDDRVLIVGGIDDEEGDPISSAKLYDPAPQEFTTVGSLEQALVGHTTTLLLDGRVLVGGLHEDRAATVELYDPSTVPTAEEAKSLTEPLPEPTPAPIVGPVYSRGTVGLSLDPLDTAHEARAICRLVDGAQRVQSVAADRRIRLGGVWVTLELTLRKGGLRLRLLTSPDIEPQTVYGSNEGTRIETGEGPDRTGSIRFEGLRLRRGKPLDLPGRARSLDGSVTWSCLPPPELGGPQAEGDPDPDDRGRLSGHVTMSSVATGSMIAALDLTGACDDPDHGFSFWSKAVSWPDGRLIIVGLQNMDGDMFVSLAPSGSKMDVIAAGAVSESIVADWPDFAVEGRLKSVDGDMLVTGAWRCG